MLVKIKSPDVARRLRGMGGESYGVDVGQPTEQYIDRARYFSVRGFNFDALCRAGRIWVVMQSRPKHENRRLVKREIERQATRYAKANAALAKGIMNPFKQVDSCEAQELER